MPTKTRMTRFPGVSVSVIFITVIIVIVITISRHQGPVSLESMIIMINITMLKKARLLYADDTQSHDDNHPDEGPVVDDFSTKPFMPTPPLEAMMEGKFNRVPFIRLGLRRPSHNNDF